MNTLVIREAQEATALMVQIVLPQRRVVQDEIEELKRLRDILKWCVSVAPAGEKWRDE